jgi:thiamine biosynthesis lipoprotein
VRRAALLGTLVLAACPSRDLGREPGPGADAAGALAEVVELRRELMGTEFRISVTGVPRDRAMPAIEAALAEVARIERLMSAHIEASDVSRINAAAGGEPVEVSAETLEVLEAARAASELSEGAFDVTFAGLLPVWRGLGESPPRLPSDEAVRAALALVGFRRLVVDRGRRLVRLEAQGMAIGLGGIAKGYGVDRAASVLESRGIHDFVVGGGGDLLVRGSKRGVPWRLGIQHPRRRGEILGEVVLREPGALVTSGDYERFVEVEASATRSASVPSAEPRATGRHRQTRGRGTRPPRAPRRSR